MTTGEKILHGGGYLIEDAIAADVFTPEDFSDGAVQLAGTTEALLDARGAKATPTLTPDGKHYLLNGTKQFITNGSFADLFTVFAKIDRVHFTAFLVERTFEGVKPGPEEKKLGIRGSPTTPGILEDAKVPLENVLGEIGKGHKIAFNVL